MHILDEELYQAGIALAACPTAPCHEIHVRTRLLERLRDLPHVTTRLDEFGNLHAHYEHNSAGREPFRLVAHMDHPAFVIQRGPEPELHFAGGVEESYFTGKKIVFHHAQDRDPLGHATITGTAFSEETKRVFIDTPLPASATFAMWDLPAAQCTSDLFVSPACDDLVQVATMLALLRRLALGGARAHVHALFTRAEEIGFLGAFAALKAEPPLMNMITLSLEASNARGFAQLGAGPIVRVGDRLSIFDSHTTNWLETAFADLTKAHPETLHQRLLMGGGTCEASVFCRAGMPAGALCVALNNYHNRAPENAIESESVSLRDWQGLFDFLHFLATEAQSPQAADQAITTRFSKLAQKSLALLRRK